MRLCAALSAILLAFLSTTIPSRAAVHRASEKVGLIRHDHVPVYAKPSAHASMLARLVQQTQVAVLRKRGGWSKVRLWASITGWVASREIVFTKPWETTSTYQAPGTKGKPRAHGPQRLQIDAVTTSPTPLVDWRSRSSRGSLPAGSTIRVTAWRQDKNGKVWYRVGPNWALGDSVRFRSVDPGTVLVRGAAIWKPVTGKGMWLTLGTQTTAAADAVAQAAMRNGITHLYLETAISPLGFHGRGAVDAILTAAHQRHIAVLAWVYPYLDDVAADVKLTQDVSRYVTPSGERFDGIAADIERNFDMWRVRAYSQLTRYEVGPHYLLVGVTYPPQSFAQFPFTEVAHSFNAIAPMDYWHQTNTSRGLDYGHMPYGYDYGRRYAIESVAKIRRISGHVPVTTIGQTFDNYGRLEMGPHAPSPDEVKGFMQGSKDAGAIGVSFFQWMTATEGEWRTIKDFRF